MSPAQSKPVGLADFLTWERAQELRYEFDGFQPVAMTGGTDGINCHSCYHPPPRP